MNPINNDYWVVRSACQAVMAENDIDNLYVCIRYIYAHASIERKHRTRPHDSFSAITSRCQPKTILNKFE